MSFDKITDTRIKYTGPDFPELGIKNGKMYDGVVVALAEGLNTLKTSYKANVECFGDDCEGELPLNEAVEKVIQTLCNMSVDNMVTSSNLFGVGASYNPSSASVTNRTMTYNTSLGNNALNFNYNAGGFASSLPSGYSLVGANIIATGTSVNNNPNISQSTQLLGGFSIPLDRLPANVDVNVRVSSPTGNIDFRRTISLPSAAPTGGNIGVDLSPSGGGGSTQYTQKQVNELLASQLSTQQQVIDSILNTLNN